MQTKGVKEQSMTERPLLSPEKRDAYLRAITELVGSIGLHESTPIHAGDFCEKHGLKPSFLDALRDLDGLVMDFTKPCTDGLIYFTRTPTLYQIEPEAVLLQMRATGSVKGKEARRDKMAVNTPNVLLGIGFSSPTDTAPDKVAEPGMVPDAPEPTTETATCNETGPAATSLSGKDIKTAYERALRGLDDRRGMVVSAPPTEKPAESFLEKLAAMNKLYSKAGMLSGQLYDIVERINAMHQQTYDGT